MADFREYDWRSSRENVWSLVGEGWMLVTAGAIGSWNTMTASWGGVGRLWDRDVVFAFVRPSRHTFGFMERSEGFTLSFFDETRRKALEVCGSVSGRDVDKARAAGITPRVFASAHAGARVAFEEARLVLSCRKLHAQDLDPTSLVDPSVARHYPEGDWHRLYIGGVEAAWMASAESSR